MSALEIMAALFVVSVGVIALSVPFMFVIDRLQREDAVRRSYPVIGRFRHLFTELGEFFRQYFFAMDREEMPFNRAQRNWVERAAAGKGNTIAFGSTRNSRIVYMIRRCTGFSPSRASGKARFMIVDIA